MNTSFYKYHGAGNDFILIDNRNHVFTNRTKENIAWLCHRRFGIGADGLILLENDDTYDFKMVYFNADGNESTMCGNGGRCIVAFAKKLKLIDTKTSFMAIDGLHHAEINENFEVNLQMKNVEKIHSFNNDFVLDTGSPHYVKFIDDFPKDFVAQARNIRNSESFIKEGINVNFILEQAENHLSIQTFERGVEDETLACGTGCVAAALCYMNLHNNTQSVLLETKGGTIKVSASKTKSGFENIWLKGPTQFVFKGTL